MNIHFTKMHGAGNDYIYVNTLLYNIDHPEELARRWSVPHKGIGSDGLVLIGRSPIPEADFTMRIFNADGSEARMCGNASRCIGKYLYEKGLTDQQEIRLLTQSGVKVLKLDVDGSQVKQVTVDMLEPRLSDASLLKGGKEMIEEVLKVGTKSFTGTFVSMGNPHWVIFTDNVSQVDVAHWGALLEYHPVFPQRCNIEFAQILDDGTIRTRVWERGSGITQACGTGACATAVAAAVTGRAGRNVLVEMDGGRLSILWSKADNHVYLSGPATFVYEGDIAI